MDIRHIFLVPLAVCLCIAAPGCRKSGSEQSSVAPSSAPSPDTLCRIHWAGKNPLGIEANAYYFSRILNLSQTLRLQSQTLDRLSTAPWRLVGGEAARTNVYSVLLRPLLDDIVQNECYFEIRQPTNQPQELVFAIRLEDARAGLWETNLANVLHSLLGAWPTSERNHAWILQRQESPQRIELVRAGEWTVIGAGGNRSVASPSGGKRFVASPSSQGTDKAVPSMDVPNQLFRNLIRQVESSTDPFGATATGRWLEADLDLPRLPLLPADAAVPFQSLPRIAIALTGDGGHVLTHAELTFPEPLPIQFEPWMIPTNRMIGPLVGFTAMRGIRPWLESWKPWLDLQIGPPPNQLCLWAPDGAPAQMLLAAGAPNSDSAREENRPARAESKFGAPAPGAGDQVNRLTGLLLSRANPWLTNHGVGQFEALPESKGVIWMGLPSISPFIRSVDNGAMFICGLDPSGGPGTNTQAGISVRPSLSALLQDVSVQTNLVCYDWELTAPRIESCLIVSQVFRVAFRRPQLSLDSASVDWLRVIKDRLGNTTTRIARTGPNQLTFDRESTLGLTGAELILLADWLESPQFPWGLYSLPTPGS